MGWHNKFQLVSIASHKQHLALADSFDETALALKWWWNGAAELEWERELVLVAVCLRRQGLETAEQGLFVVAWKS